MDKKEKKSKEIFELQKNESISELLSFEYYDWRLKALAEKIKLENYRPRIKIYNF